MPIDPKALNDKELRLYQELRDVMDPEIGASIVDMGLIDEISVEGDEARVVYHLTIPMCPAPMALYIGNMVKKKLLKVEGVNKRVVRVTDHYFKDQINKILAEDEPST